VSNDWKAALMVQIELSASTSGQRKWPATRVGRVLIVNVTNNAQLGQVAGVGALSMI